MTTQTTLARVQQAFSAAFGVAPESVTIDSGPDDVDGWDSLGHAALVSALEQVFAVQFDIDEVMEMENMAAVVRIVDARLKADGR